VVVAESLLVVASVGVQLTTTFASGRQTAMFYNIGDISGIVINEAVTMVKHRVVLDLHCDIVIVSRCNSNISATCYLYKSLSCGVLQCSPCPEKRCHFIFACNSA